MSENKTTQVNLIDLFFYLLCKSRNGRLISYVANISVGADAFLLI